MHNGNMGFVGELIGTAFALSKLYLGYIYLLKIILEVYQDRMRLWHKYMKPS